MSDNPKFRIEATRGGYGSHVWLDGAQLKNVRSLYLELGVGRATKLTLEFIGVEVEVEGEFEAAKLERM